MKNKQAHQLLITTIAIALILAMIPITGHTAIPQKINYQGYLTDPQGTAIDGTVSIVFSIYSSSSGGTALWSETRTVTVTDGVFSVDLGNTTPLNLPFDTLYYLGITIGSDSEMTPRQPLTSTGYAFRAKEADSVKEGAVTTVVIANDAVTTDKVADDAISGDKIAQGAVTSTNIANGSVGSIQIGDNSINTQDLADNAVTAAKISPNIISSIDGVSNDGGNVDLEAGTNITITPDDTANKITIAASGGGSSSLWTESGGNVYRNSGNVGIGTESPQVKLSFGTDPFTPRKIALWDGVNDFYGFGIELGRLTFLTNDTEKMTILDNGNVGIGTENPDDSYKLHVVNSDVIPYAAAICGYATTPSTQPVDFLQKGGVYSEVKTSYYGVGVMGVTDANTGQAVAGDNTYSGNYGFLAGPSMAVSGHCKDENNFAGYFIGKGYFRNNLGINTADPQQKLHVVGNNPRILIEASSSNPEINFKNSGDPPTSIWSIYKNGSTGDLQFYQNSNKLTIQKNTGNVGIGTTSPGYLLEVNGTAGKPGGSTWSNSSDIRLKDIKGDYTRGLEKINQLKPIRFRYKEDNPRGLPSDTDEIGFVAQEVIKSFPEAVSEGEDGYLDLNMHSINVAMVNAVKELSKRIKKLEKQNKDLLKLVMRDSKKEEDKIVTVSVK
jgi:hypothetical protein